MWKQKYMEKSLLNLFVPERLLKRGKLFGENMAKRRQYYLQGKERSYSDIWDKEKH